MTENSENVSRKGWMSTLAKAPAGLLAEAWQQADVAQSFAWLRAPEIGTVMVRGAMGGTGAPFNLGELTVTRCALRLDDGTVGHAYISGRDRQKAEIAALCDALMQTSEASAVQAKIINPLTRAYQSKRASKAEKAAATKVDFFTLVRGED
ncbi:MAG: phosphonate C-P lyase system protein PhnG [Rhodobacteraceae bacterium]|nr:phosphonate C-P lyase system protein PhnG [Paracoccaceae bacterium]